MAKKDLQSYFRPNLELPVGDVTYSVPPPTREVGLKMTAVAAFGMAQVTAGRGMCPTCGRTGEAEMSDDIRDLLKSMEDMSVAELTLTPTVVAQMEKDGVPEDAQDMMGQYALYFWIYGEATADAMFDATLGNGAQTEDDVPKA